MNARELRLAADYERVKARAVSSGGTLSIESTRGRPPDEYVLTFRCRGIEAVTDGKPVYRFEHQVLLRLPAKYPAPYAPPYARMLTPLFHPHVYKNMEICMGSWHTSEFLEDFVMRIGALIQYDRAYLNVKDPANRDALEWAHKHLLMLPTDRQRFENDSAPRHRIRSHAPAGWVELDDTL